MLDLKLVAPYCECILGFFYNEKNYNCECK
jgi:hypothetical protein